MAVPDNFERKQRTCLKCGKLFDSAHAGNRICPGCGKLNEKEYIPRTASTIVYNGDGIPSVAATNDD